MKIALYQQITHHLLDQIRQGHLSSGDRVPSEKELAEQFNVSRITSKKALETLVQMRVIERARGRGSFVAQALPDLTALDGLGEDDASPMPVLAGETLAGKRRMIGVVLAGFADSYGAALLHAIEQRCAELGLFVVMKLTHGERDQEERAIDALVGLGVSGLIVFPVHGEYYNAALLRLVLNNFPIVIVDRYLKGIPAQAVYTDNVRAGQQLTEYLFAHGHQQIGFVSPSPENTSTIEDRLQGFTQAHGARGLPLRADHIFTEIFSTLPGRFQAGNVEIDRDNLCRFIESAPEITAFVAIEYNIALILRRAILHLGRRIPEDYAVVCFDSSGNALSEVTFTHIQQDEPLMGRAAVDGLLAQFERGAGETVPTHQIVDFKLIEGDSTRAPGTP